jgi:membrane protein YdbS with pleckstrin-like domain
VPDLTIQPTNKWIRIQYWTVFLVLCVCIGLYVNKFADKPSLWDWLLALPALLFFFPARGQLRRRFTKVTLAGGELRYESGVLSKTTRTIPVSKVQDVRAEQTFTQRLFGIGDVMVETAGETGALEIANIDNPQRVVEAILDAQGPAAKQKQEPE